MTLYHGSNLIVEKPVILPHNRFLDFGSGFYTTPSKEQAVRFSEIVENRRGGEATVSIYNYNDTLANEQLGILRFDKPDISWLDFVTQNRRGASPNKSYDIISGPVADDKVYETVNFYTFGILSATETLERLKVYKPYNQLVFCTEKALNFIEFIGIL